MKRLLRGADLCWWQTKHRVGSTLGSKVADRVKDDLVSRSNSKRGPDARMHTHTWEALSEVHSAKGLSHVHVLWDNLLSRQIAGGVTLLLPWKAQITHWFRSKEMSLPLLQLMLLLFEFKWEAWQKVPGSVPTDKCNHYKSSQRQNEWMSASYSLCWDTDKSQMRWAHITKERGVNRAQSQRWMWCYPVKWKRDYASWVLSWKNSSSPKDSKGIWNKGEQKKSNFLLMAHTL